MVQKSGQPEYRLKQRHALLRQKERAPGTYVAIRAIYFPILSFVFHAIERHLALSVNEPASSLSKLAWRY